MTRCPRPHLTLLALITASGLSAAEGGLRPLPRDQVATLRAQEPARALRIEQALEAQKVSLGLGFLDGLKAYNDVTDAFGRTHVRCHQTYRGVDVYNGTVLGHMDAAGRMMKPHATVQKDIDLEPATLLPEAKVLEIVQRNIPQGGKLWPLKATLLVFPTKYQDGIKFTRQDGRLAVDRVYSVGTARKAEPYRWAYKVCTLQDTPSGPLAIDLILDGETGEILKKWDPLQRADTPSVGTGNSQYSGQVSVNTLHLTDSTKEYVLRDTTRATRQWPDPQNLGLLDFWPEWGGIGSQTMCQDYSSHAVMNWSSTYAFTNASDIYGDGQRFVWATDYDPTFQTSGKLYEARGQTAGVDAHFGLQCAWDYYDRVLGRSGGIDGQGGSLISMVHVADFMMPSVPWNDTYWNPDWFEISYGDGAEMGSRTCLDVVGHEVSHGVMTYTADLSEDWGCESGGLNEANSDIHAIMLKYYQWGAGGQGDVVPDTATKSPDGDNTPGHLWTMWPQLSKDGTPVRWLTKPSKDGFSYDAWFDGMGLDDVHYTQGPASRAFYFLSQGAPSDVSQDAYSPYLPGGMKGIGNDAAIKIWYNAMAHHVTDKYADFHAIRDAMLESAAELHPGSGSADSAEVAAVKNAFAAINVGTPADGTEHVTISFPVVNVWGYLWYPKTLVAPAMVPAVLPGPDVAHATDPSVTWSLGGMPNVWTEGGELVDNGVFVAPNFHWGTCWPVKVTSNEDPKQFAVNLVYSASMDCDCDTDTDACDMGAMALAYGGFDLYGVYPASNFDGTVYGVDDFCVELMIEGFNNAYNH